MIYTHETEWHECLSHAVMPAIREGFGPLDKDNKKPRHFFWGLGSTNINKIQNLDKMGIEWWMVDVGYLTLDIKRYPVPDIMDYNKTYFRFCKGSLHNNLTNVSSDPTRYNKLLDENIWYPTRLENEYVQKPINQNGHVLMAPSSPTVSKVYYGLTQEGWCHFTEKEIKENTNRKIEFRNKPRPGNPWWLKPVEKDLENAYCIVTNMSLVSIDALINGVPVICDKRNICASVAATDMKDINNLKVPTKNKIRKWMQKAANTQFTIEEIRKGIGYEFLNQ